MSQCATRSRAKSLNVFHKWQYKGNGEENVTCRAKAGDTLHGDMDIILDIMAWILLSLTGGAPTRTVFRTRHSRHVHRSNPTCHRLSAPSRQVPTDMYQVMGSFQTLLNSIQKTTQSHVCDRSNEALKLIETKRSLQQKLRELSDDSDADEDDKLLIRMNLDTVVQRIRDNIQC